jgi:hypothetical protein
MPSSTCAVSGLSETLWDRTSDSQRVFTKVVRPVPEAPKSAQVKDVEESKRSVYKGRLTDDHDRELNTLFDLVASASSGERHCGTSVV